MALQHLISTHILQHNSHEKLLRVLIKQIFQGVASAWLIGLSGYTGMECRDTTYKSSKNHHDQTILKEEQRNFVS
jgi:hypothetical protein